MIPPLPHKKYSINLLLALFGFLMVSCGSYQQASYYDSDGIYTDAPQRVTTERYQQPPAQRRAVKDDQNVYGNYFGQKAQEYGEILDSEIFTDVDSYAAATAQDSLDLDAEDNYYYDPNNTYEGYAGWGDNATRVNINIYDDWGWGGFGYGLGYPWVYGNFGWGWNNPWRWNYGWGWNNWGWNNWGWGFNYGWGWNNWGWGWNNWGWGYPGYWGSFYGHPYYGYGRGYYGYGGYAWNRSRRGFYDTSIAANAVRGRSNLNTRLRSTDTRYRTNSGRSNLNTRSSYDRATSRYQNGVSARRSVGVDGIERNRSYRTSRSSRAVPGYSSQSRSGQTYRSTRPGTGTYSRGNATNRSAVGRSTYSRTAPRSNSGYSRSSSSPSRSSGYRSSGSSGSSRSSGYRSSGGNAPSRSSGYRSSGSSSRSSGSFRSSSAPSRSSGARSSGGGRRSN